jgi:hypothetical protein
VAQKGAVCHFGAENRVAVRSLNRTESLETFKNLRPSTVPLVLPRSVTPTGLYFTTCTVNVVTSVLLLELDDCACVAVSACCL